MDTRKAVANDLPRMMEIYGEARAFMRRNGNMSQWIDGYPSESVLRADMASGNLYVCEDAGFISGVFALVAGEDPTYAEIDGRWVDVGEYATLHRVASADGAHGVADAALACALSGYERVRVDTHADNLPMRRWIESRGFTYCGVIRVADGSPRRAYSLSRE